MKITKDLQDYLGIISIIIQKDGKDYFSYFSRYNDSLLTLQIAMPIVFTIHEQITLQINFNNGTEVVKAAINDFGVNYCLVTLNEDIPVNVLGMIQALNLMIKNDEYYGRRKEPRIKLGLIDYSKFNLSQKEQIVFSQNTNLMQPCVLLDVSMHGVCFITHYNSLIGKLDNYKLKISFVSPLETVIIDAHKVHVNIKQENNIKYGIFSCQLLEPIHYRWKNNIIRMIKK